MQQLTCSLKCETHDVCSWRTVVVNVAKGYMLYVLILLMLITYCNIQLCV